MKELKEILNLFEKEKKYDIFLVANAVEHSEKMTYYEIKHASSDEFFNLDEFQEITTALFKTGSYVNIYYTETEFIQDILEHSQNMNLKDIIVYNLARDGIKEGKKSLIPSFCDLFSIKYSGSNAFVISLCRNKFSWTSIASNNGILVPKTIYYNNGLYSESIDVLKGKRVIIKNVFESASIGLDEHSIITCNKNEIAPFLLRETPILIQEFIDGVECEVPFFNFNGKILVLDPVLINISKSNIITSEISVNYSYSFDFLNNHIENSVCEKIKKITEKLAFLLGMQTYGRIDFRIDKNKNFYVFDIAATPYTIKHSSFAFLFKKYGLNYEDIYKIILYASLKKY